jgi:hypothetical protein
MSNPNTPAGGQPANLPAETSAKRSGTLKMPVNIPADWNPHSELLAIADYARNLVRRAERRDDIEAANGERYGNEKIDAHAVREINMMACLLAMRLAACTITIHREDSAE